VSALSAWATHAATRTVEWAPNYVSVGDNAASARTALGSGSVSTSDDVACARTVAGSRLIVAGRGGHGVGSAWEEDWRACSVRESGLAAPWIPRAWGCTMSSCARLKMLDLTEIDEFITYECPPTLLQSTTHVGTR